MTPGERLRTVRDLLGLTREQMCDEVGIGFVRYSNVEQEKVRMSVDDLESVVKAFPEFETWLASGTLVQLSALKKSKDARVRSAAARIEAGFIPEAVLKKSVNR